MAKGVPVCPLHTAAVYLFRVSFKERGWLYGSATVSTLQQWLACLVCQAALFTVNEKEAKCLTTGLRGQDNSLPVVLENYNQGCFYKEANVDIVNGVQHYLSIRVRNSLQNQGCVAGTQVCLCDRVTPAVSSVCFSVNH